MNIDNIFSLFGLAAFHSSVLEEALDHICIMNETVINQEKYKKQGTNKAVFKKYEKTTLGNYINDLKKVLGKGKHSDLVDSMFKPALEKRNYLIHQFYIEHKIEIHTGTNLSDIANELKQIVAVIEPASKVACEMRDMLNNLYEGRT